MLPDVPGPQAGLLAARFAHWVPQNLRRVIVYGCVGIAISLFYSLAVIFFVWLLYPIRPTIASIIAFATTMPVAYLAHVKISFSDSSNDKFQPMRFAFVTTASFIVAIGGMYWITELAGRSYLLGIAWNWLIIPAMNFISYMIWVFRTGRKIGS